MIVCALIQPFDHLSHSVSGCTSDKTHAVIYTKILGPEAGGLLNSILEPLAGAMEHGGFKGIPDLDSKLATLFRSVIETWCLSNPNEAPTKEWMLHYLTVDLASGAYTAFNEADLLWAVYSYFSWKQPEVGEGRIGVEKALADLASPAILHRIEPWPKETLKKLGECGGIFIV